MARSAGRRFSIDKLAQLRRARRLKSAGTLGLVIMGPILGFATYLFLGPLDKGTGSTAVIIMLLVDFIYVISLAALVLSGVMRMVLERRRKHTTSQLHMRLTGAFALLALLPTIVVAVFTILVINLGFEGWFSERVRVAIGHSLDAADAYQAEQRQILTNSAEELAADITRTAPAGGETQGALRERLAVLFAAYDTRLSESYILNSLPDLYVRGPDSYLFTYEHPSLRDIDRAANGETVLIEDWDNNEFRAIVKLDGYFGLFLYVSREVDGNLLTLLDDTQETATFYEQLRTQRGAWLARFALFYLGFATIIVLAAIWLGMWFAGRLSQPIERLARAADRVREGDLNIQVIEEPGNDELATLGRVFNRMVRDINSQRGELIENNEKIEERRRLFDSVLSSVTAGVIGLDPSGRVTFLNRAAERLLDLEPGQGEGQDLGLLVPEFAPLFDAVGGDAARGQAQEELGLSRMGKQERLLVRIAQRGSEDEIEGFVIAFDDVTNLVAAQRMAAWGDVARRIAHEIKNPLTPIQLSAERIKRKFGRKLDEADASDLENLTGVIVRQTEDLRRIVDEFSKFARMPEPQRRAADLASVLRDAVTLQKAGQEGVEIEAEIPSGGVPAEIDETMIGQALTNLIKNAGEAVESYQEKGAHGGHEPRIKVTLSAAPELARITIADNGIGLPEDRARLFEPYVTTREKGTGLGLPIVKKIIEEHGGTLVLTDAPAFGPGDHVGAMAVIELPLPKADLAIEAAQ